MHRPDRQISPVEMPASDGSGLPRWRRILLKVCISGIVLTSIVLVLDVIGALRLRTAMEAVRASGEPLTYEEILARRPPSPEGANAAAVFLELRPRLLEPDRGSGADRFSFRRRGRWQSLPGYRWSDEERREVVETLERYQAELEQLDRLQDLPDGNLPLAIVEGARGPIRRPLYEVRLAVRLCSLRALYGVEEGDTNLLLKSTRTILRLSRLIMTLPSSTGAVVSCSCDEQAVWTIERACGLTVLPVETLVALQEALAEAEQQEPLYWGLLADRAAFFDAGQVMLKTGRSVVSGVPPTGWVPGMRGVLMMDVATGLRLHSRLVAEGHDPGSCLNLATEMARRESSVPRVYWLTQNLFPRPGRLCHQVLQRLARLRAARTALAAERFRLEKGRFPNQLAELTPEYLPEPPVDPFNGRILRYNVDAQGAAVYSSAEGIHDPWWGGRGPSGMSSELGFTLLPPERRGLPAALATQPAVSESAPSAE
ncbi:MAG TPA: hypothetical protein PKG54_04435 [Phycisphaerae bacterium]|nr:hypothetical protein [Phycisphaerae bacterium]HOB73753.1 hypothetical protein [Phycisphaerae bacterium]HOJ53373.1 hypothetical protein [Phycisphaerae bacterium]HOL25503.1 hypothetical protein [Phycisphaerae bacterium]HPP19820.1 hypothetical protein [Phycisphaerae bacterium]